MKSIARIVFVFFLLFLVSFLPVLTSTAKASEVFWAPLRGSQEVPPVATLTTGDAYFRVNRRSDSIDVRVDVRRGVGITQAHIHCAPAGQNGGVVVWLAGLLQGGGHDIDGRWIGSASFDSGAIVNAACGATIAQLVQAMRSGQAYVNVHSADHPAGVVRGQIRPMR
jgi:hypothetical protein